MIPMVAVESSNVEAVGYDLEERRLLVRFKAKEEGRTGALYEYDGVPEVTFVGMIAADSVGGFLNEHVKKPGYGYRRVE